MLLVVLNDGTTFSALDGCKIVLCPTEKYDGELSEEDIAQLESIDLGQIYDTLVDADAYQNFVIDADWPDR